MADSISIFWQVPHGVHMAVGDEVEFIVGVNSKSGERLARMLKRTKEAPTAPPVEVVPERNPNAMKFTGNLKVSVSHQCFLRLKSPCVELVPWNQRGGEGAMCAETAPRIWAGLVRCCSVHGTICSGIVSAGSKPIHVDMVAELREVYCPHKVFCQVIGVPHVRQLLAREKNISLVLTLLQSGLKDSPAARAPRMPDGSAGFLPGPWCERRAAALEAEAEAERAKAAAAAAKEQKDAATAAAAAGDAPFLFVDDSCSAHTLSESPIPAGR